MQKVKKIAQQIIKGLNDLKQAGLVHCDLKPENILYTDDKNE